MIKIFEEYTDYTYEEKYKEVEDMYLDLLHLESENFFLEDEGKYEEMHDISKARADWMYEILEMMTEEEFDEIWSKVEEDHEFDSYGYI